MIGQLTGALLIGSGALGLIRCFKRYTDKKFEEQAKFFEEQNKIEDKIFISEQIIFVN